MNFFRDWLPFLIIFNKNIKQHSFKHTSLRIRCDIFHSFPSPYFCRCRHFSVGGASGRGGVDSRGQGMASEEFGPSPNSLAKTHQPRGGRAALFSATKQGETKRRSYRSYPVTQVQYFVKLFTLHVWRRPPPGGWGCFSVGRSDWQQPFAQTQQNEPTPLDTACKTSVAQQDGARLSARDKPSFKGPLQLKILNAFDPNCLKKW